MVTIFCNGKSIFCMCHCCLHKGFITLTKDDPLQGITVICLRLLGLYNLRELSGKRCPFIYNFYCYIVYERPISYKSVSYTHLDVYKRQGQLCDPENWWPPQSIHFIGSVQGSSPHAVYPQKQVFTRSHVYAVYPKRKHWKHRMVWSINRFMLSRCILARIFSGSVVLLKI